MGKQLSIGEPISVTVAKYDPTRDSAPRYMSYEVPYTREMRILETLDYIVEELGESLAYQWFCGVKKCGACGMLVNGRQVLSCWEPVEREMVIEPLPRFPVVKDLVIDPSRYWDEMTKIEPWLQRGSEYPGHPEFLTSTEMAASAEASTCIECMLCTSACPSFNVGSDVFAGPTVMTQLARWALDPRDAGPRAKQAIEAGISACVTCGACTAVCPMHISISPDILELRHKIAEAPGLPKKAQLAVRAFRSPRLVGFASRAAAIASTPFRRGSFTRVPGPKRQVSWRTPPAVPLRQGRDRLRSAAATPAIAETRAAGRRVMLFMQCVSDRLVPDVVVATARLLEAAGAKVVVPKDQHCCGLPAFDAGDRESAKRMAAATIKAFEGVDDVVTPAPSCLLAMAYEYAVLFKGDSEWEASARAFSERVYDLVGYLTKVARLPSGSLAGDGETSVTVHRFCQSGNLLGRTDEIENLIQDLCGVEVTPLPENGVCCGFGGSASLSVPEVTRDILSRKLSCADQTAAATLITDNPGCVLHMRGGADASGRALDVLHIAEFLAARIPERSGRHAQSQGVRNENNHN